jgi:hypothetical protein
LDQTLQSPVIICSICLIYIFTSDVDYYPIIFLGFSIIMLTHGLIFSKSLFKQIDITNNNSRAPPIKL